MPEYHVNCGLDEIYAGVLKKNSTEWRTKSPVTDEAINAVIAPICIGVTLIPNII